MNRSASNVRLPYNLNTKDGLTNFLEYITAIFKKSIVFSNKNIAFYFMFIFRIF